MAAVFCRGQMHPVPSRLFLFVSLHKGLWPPDLVGSVSLSLLACFWLPSVAVVVVEDLSNKAAVAHAPLPDGAMAADGAVLWPSPSLFFFFFFIVYFFSLSPIVVFASSFFYSTPLLPLLALATCHTFSHKLITLDKNKQIKFTTLLGKYHLLTFKIIVSSEKVFFFFKTNNFTSFFKKDNY